MAKLSGGEYITFKKPYLVQVANLIKEGKKLKIDGEEDQVINMTPDVKKYIKAVDDKNQTAVNTILKTGSAFLPIFNGYRWTNIDKGQFTGKGGGGGSDGATTAMQERASLYAIQVGIENNGYSDRAKFFKEHRDELLKLYPDMDEEWESTFFEQQKTVVRELGPTKYSHYSRDEGFMDWITKFCSKKYGIVKKDSWNPADIWLVNDLANVKRTLEQLVKDDVTSIKQFNAILRDMFHERKVVGISLKKMSGKTAQWELVNLEDNDLFDDDEYTFKLESAACDCNLKNKQDFKTTDSRINLSSKKQKITFQIRQNSAGINNLKIEGTDIGATAARLGKVPLPMAANVFKAYSIPFDNNNKNFPTTVDEFVNQKAEWIKIFNRVKQYTNVASASVFEENILSVFGSDRPDYAHSKLMQLKLFDSIFSLKGDKLDQLLTELAFLAQKKGAVFGPFGKLY